MRELANAPASSRVLYFSTHARGRGFSPEPAGAMSADVDLYSSEWKGGRYEAPTLVPGVNSNKDDMQPYIQLDALEVYFSSEPPGNAAPRRQAQAVTVPPAAAPAT